MLLNIFNKKTCYKVYSVKSVSWFQGRPNIRKKVFSLKVDKWVVIDTNFYVAPHAYLKIALL